MRKQHQKPIIQGNKKQCTKCKILKNFSEFHKFSNSPDGHKHYCKQCVKEYDLSNWDKKRVFTPLVKTDTHIQCRRCEQIKPIAEYSRRNNKYFKSYCKKCSYELGSANNIHRKGISVEEYEELEKKQNGLCKICNSPEQKNKRLSIDHDHKCCPGYDTCGKCNRGLLCSRCNKVLGQVNDDIETLTSMIDYLKGKI
jgi:hypothetical protein